jgi:hypothetical protein
MLSSTIVMNVENAKSIAEDGTEIKMQIQYNHGLESDVLSIGDISILATSKQFDNDSREIGVMFPVNDSIIAQLEFLIAFINNVRATYK